MPIKAVIFDMDGTLVDSEKVSVKAWGLAAERRGIDLPFETIHSFIGRNFRSYRAQLAVFVGSEQVADELLELHREEFTRLCETELTLKPGAHEVIAELHAMGLPLALATSTSRVRAIPRLERFDMQDEFTTTICGDDIENGKPAPDIFLTAAIGLGVDPTECAVVEDSFNGVRSGHAAGSQVFMVPDMVKPTGEIIGLCAAVLPTLFEVPAAIDLRRDV